MCHLIWKVVLCIASSNSGSELDHQYMLLNASLCSHWQSQGAVFTVTVTRNHVHCDSYSNTCSLWQSLGEAKSTVTVTMSSLWQLQQAMSTMTVTRSSWWQLQQAMLSVTITTSNIHSESHKELCSVWQLQQAMSTLTVTRSCVQCDSYNKPCPLCIQHG